MGILGEDGKVRYNGFSHLCGVRLQGEDAWVETAKDMKHLDGDRMYTVDDSFKVSFEEQIHLLHKEFPAPVLQMEIDAHLPVALAEGYDPVPSAVYTVSQDEQGNVTVREEDAQSWKNPPKTDSQNDM